MHLKFNKTIESRPFNSNEFIEFAKKLNLHSFVYANETIIRWNVYYLRLQLWYSANLLHWLNRWLMLEFVYWCLVWWSYAVDGCSGLVVVHFAVFDSLVGHFDVIALVAVWGYCILGTFSIFGCIWFQLCSLIKVSSLSKIAFFFLNFLFSKNNREKVRHFEMCVSVCL